MGFIPPTGVKHWATPVNVRTMIAGIVTSTPPFMVQKIKKRSGVAARPDPVLVDTGDGGGSATTRARASDAPNDP